MTENRKTRVVVHHDPFNEQVLIAAAIRGDDHQRRRLASVRPELFHGDGHAAVWRAFRAAVDRGLAPTPQVLRRLGGAAVKTPYVVQLLKSHPETPPNIAHHVHLLDWDAARRRCAEGPLSAFVDLFRDPTADPERVKALARQIGSALGGNRDGHAFEDPAALRDAVLRDVDERINGQAIYPFGVAGFDRRVDDTWRVVPGLAPGLVTLVTALSGSGKTTSIANIIVEQVRMKRRVLFGGWEPNNRISLRLLATLHMRASRYDVVTGSNPEKWRADYERAVDEILAYVQFWKFPWGRIRGDRPRDNEEAVDRVHACIADSGADVVVFDLVRRIIPDRRLDKEEWAIEMLYVVAEETRTHHIWSHQQLLKEVERRPDKRPGRDSVKGSAQYVEVPDNVLAVHLPALWKNVPNNTIEWILLKQRDGKWPIAVEFDYDADRALMSNAREVEYSMTGRGSGTAAAGGVDPVDNWFGD